MNALIWFGRALVMLVLVWFAVKNSQSVTLYGALDYNWQAPLVLIILVFFAAGAIFGLLAAFGTVFKLKREVKRLRKQLSDSEAQGRAASHHASPADVPAVVNLPPPAPHGD
jgi:lipopolysaccharide assembly protein A